MMIKSAKQSKKNSNQVKLPQIKSKQSSDRPSSSNKVQELHKKLLNKLDSYDQQSKSKQSNQFKKKSNFSTASSEMSSQENSNFQNLQKLMPNLYGKLKQMKQSEINPFSTSQKNILEAQASNTAKNKDEKKLSQKNIELTKNSQIQQQQAQQPNLSNQQMEQFFNSYKKDEGIQDLLGQSNLKDIQKNIDQCEQGLQDVEQSMLELIKQVGWEYVKDMQIS